MTGFILNPIFMLMTHYVPGHVYINAVNKETSYIYLQTLNVIGIVLLLHKKQRFIPVGKLDLYVSPGCWF